MAENSTTSSTIKAGIEVIDLDELRREIEASLDRAIRMGRIEMGRLGFTGRPKVTLRQNVPTKPPYLVQAVKYERAAAGTRCEMRDGAQYIQIRDGSVRRLVPHPDNPLLEIVGRKTAKKAGVLPDRKGRIRVAMNTESLATINNATPQAPDFPDPPAMIEKESSDGRE